MEIYKEDIVDIDLKETNIYRNMMMKTIGENDSYANVFGVRVFKNGEPIELTSATCSGYFIRSDGATIIINGSIGGNLAVVSLPQSCYAYEGQFSLAIKVTSDGTTDTLRIVDGMVLNTETGQYIDPGTILPTIDELLAAIDAAIAEIPGDYEELSKAVESGIQEIVHTIDWRDGYYDPTTGAYTSATTYKCTTAKYPRELFPFLTNWLINAYDYVSLFNGNTYVGYYNESHPGAMTENEWDGFRLTVQKSGHPAGTDDIRFVTLGNVDEIQQDDIFILDTPVIWWRQGSYLPADGTYSPDSPRYKCTQLLYKKEYLKFLNGWNYNDNYCYISLYNEGTFIGIKNAGQKIPETGWNTFGLTVYLASVNNNVESIRFDTQKAIGGIISRAMTKEPSYIRWKQGYYDPSTGVYDGTSTRYKCSDFYFKRDLLKYLQGWDFQTNYNYLCLYNSSGAFVGIINNGNMSRLYDNNWTLFTLTVFMESSPVTIPEIRFLQMLNNHVGMEVSTAAELIDAVQIAINNTDRERYYDIYLKSGTYELWPVLDKSQISGTGDQLYHRGLELPDKCNLIGIGNVTISCTIPESDNSEEHPYTRIVSTLNMHNTENLLENITIVGNNTRYCIHDDSGFDDNFKQLVMRNCKFIHNGTASETYMPHPRCYGAGYTTGRKALFENCTFASSGSCTVQLYIHTHQGDYNLSDIETVVRNCAFISQNKTAIDYQVMTSDVYGGIFSLYNCWFAEGCIFLIRGGSGQVSNPSAEIYGGGNGEFTLNNQAGATIYLVN